MRSSHGVSRHFWLSTAWLQAHNVDTNAGIINFGVGTGKDSHGQALSFGNSSNANAFWPHGRETEKERAESMKRTFRMLCISHMCFGGESQLACFWVSSGSCPISDFHVNSLTFPWKRVSDVLCY